MKYQERLIAGLLALGFTACPSRSGKYQAFNRNELDKENRDVYLFVGSSGALRKGHCASDSFSIGDPARQSPAYRLILEKGDKALDKSSFAGF
jgi:hypothetical protein